MAHSRDMWLLVLVDVCHLCVSKTSNDKLAGVRKFRCFVRVRTDEDERPGSESRANRVSVSRECLCEVHTPFRADLCGHGLKKLVAVGYFRWVFNIPLANIFDRHGHLARS